MNDLNEKIKIDHDLIKLINAALQIEFNEFKLTGIIKTMDKKLNFFFENEQKIVVIIVNNNHFFISKCYEPKNDANVITGIEKDGKKYIADFNNYISINQYKERTEITVCIFVVTKDLCFEKKLIDIDEILVLDKLNFFEEK